MTRHQRGLVDTCFEEGQYESAIAVLDQLRSPKYKPAVSHIRQLLYIALYPHDNTKHAADLDPASLRKAAKQQKCPLFPSQAATAAAQRLLTTMATTNTPGALFRALPSYSDTSSISNVARELGDDDEDSLIGREAICIKESKSCWSILRQGFIQCRMLTVSSPSGKRNAKNSRRDLLGDDSLFNPVSGMETPSVVAPNAWPVLDWMITIFEIDEIEQVNNGLTRYSPLLLSQIPSPRGGSGARWEVDAPLEIIFKCFQQTEQRCKIMGARLLTSLINLTSTVHLDMPIFVTTVFTRLSSFTADEVSALFSMLAPSPIICKFKIALCQKYITSTSINHHAETSDLRPKPQARAQPRSTPLSRCNTEQDKEDRSHNLTPGLTVVASIASRYSPPPSAEILRLIEKDAHNSRAPTAVAAFIQIKFELLVAFGNLQKCAAAEDKDPEWPDMLCDGRLTKSLDNAFKFGNEDLGQVYRGALQEMIAIW